MEITLSYTADTSVKAIQRAAAAFNLARRASEPDAVDLTPEEFMVHTAAVAVEGYKASYLTTRLDPIDFLKRFTPAERAEMRAAAKMSTELDDFLQLMNAAKSVYLTDPDTVAGVHAMATHGIIEPARVAAILSL